MPPMPLKPGKGKEWEPRGRSCKLLTGINTGQDQNCRYNLVCWYECDDGFGFYIELNWSRPKCPDYWDDLTS